MSNLKPGQKSLLWFIAGCVLTAALFYFILLPQLKSLRKTQDQLLQGQQAHNSQMMEQIQNLQSNLQVVTKERDGCKVKFDRGTILYDEGILAGSIRAWYIPADVEPTIFNGKRGNYTHYDPNTQTETIHLQPKAQ